MSYTNGTTHYNLPQTTGSDKRDWSDTNQSFADVDAALYGAVQNMAQAELDIDALETRMDTAEQNIATNTGDIAGLDTRVTTVEGAVTSLSGQVTDTRQDLEDMICAYNEASATSTHAYDIGDYFIYNDVLYKAIQTIAIGDTIVPDTNCTTTNVTTELLSIEDLSGDVTQLQSDIATAQQDISDIEDALGSATLIETVDGTSQSRLQDLLNACMPTVLTMSTAEMLKVRIIALNRIYKVTLVTDSGISLTTERCSPASDTMTIDALYVDRSTQRIAHGGLYSIDGTGASSFTAFSTILNSGDAYIYKV